MGARLLTMPGVEAAFIRQIPMGRIAMPSDIADMILWLSQSAYVTGLNMPASGGMHLTQPPRPDQLTGLS